MEIRGFKFTNCLIASGGLNFFGDGWWYDDIYKVIVPGFKDVDKATFVAKTATFNALAGNMPLDENLQPKELVPACIKPYLFEGSMFNAVGLSNPGAEELFSKNIWQNIDKPFFLSFMAVGKTKEERLAQTRGFAEMLKLRLRNFRCKPALQVNLSCPNTGEDTASIMKETISLIEPFAGLGILVNAKVNALASFEIIKELQYSGLCQLLTVGNTIPYGKTVADFGWTDADVKHYKLEEIDWKKYGPISPLSQFGGGGYSGAPLIKITPKAITRFRDRGITMPIIGGGGIMKEEDVWTYKAAGVNGIEVATVLILRPHRFRGIFETAQQAFD